MCTFGIDRPTQDRALNWQKSYELPSSPRDHCAYFAWLKIPSLILSSLSGCGIYKLRLRRGATCGSVCGFTCKCLLLCQQNRSDFGSTPYTEQAKEYSETLKRKKPALLDADILSGLLSRLRFGFVPGCSQ